MLKDSIDEKIETRIIAIEQAVEKVQEISQKLSNITKIKIKDYVDNIKMLDLGDDTTK